MNIVSDYRLTFIWTRPIIDHLLPLSRSAQPPLGLAVDESKYRLWFDALPAVRDHAQPAPPWPPHGGENFWSRYLNAPLESVSGAVAWRQVVPVRIPSPVFVEHDTANTRVQTEGLVYPWAISLILTVVCRKPWADLHAVATNVLRDRREQCYSVTGGPTLVDLDAIANLGLSKLRTQAFGSVGPAQQLPRPFSVFSVVHGASIKAKVDPAAAAVHQLLQAAAAFSSTWESDKLNDYADDAGGLRERPQSHVLMAVPRGRALWAPEHFAAKPNRHTLACRHRNLVYGSAHVDALCEFAQSTADDAGVGVLGAVHRAMASRAMPALGGLYLGAGSTFRSRSLARQVVDRDALPAINALRDRVALEPLPALTPVMPAPAVTSTPAASVSPSA